MRRYSLPDLADQVDTLPFLSDSRSGSFFALPKWFELVSECLSGSGYATTILAADNGCLALAGCQRDGKKSLRSCTNLYSTEFDFLGDSSNIEAVRSFAREVTILPMRLHSVQLEGLDPVAGSFRAALGGLRSAGWLAKPYFGWAVWHERLVDISFERYLSTRDAALRNTWRRKQALLSKTAESRWQIYRSGDDLESLISAYENVRERSWKKPEPFPHFIGRVIRLAGSTGALRMGLLFINEIPAAAQFWIVWAGRATIYKLVYAEEYARFSPGTLLTMEMMRRILDKDKPSIIDFGRGDDGYKKLWLNSRGERWGIEAANPRAFGGLSRSFRILAGMARNTFKAKRFYDDA